MFRGVDPKAEQLLEYTDVYQVFKHASCFCFFLIELCCISIHVTMSTLIVINSVTAGICKVGGGTVGRFLCAPSSYE
jgi:hypothetical protein